MNINEQVEWFEQLHRVVLERPVPRFDMEKWVQDSPCGTVCCAIGSAAEDAWFQARGLRLRAGWPMLGLDTADGALGDMIGYNEFWWLFGGSAEGADYRFPGSDLARPDADDPYGYLPPSIYAPTPGEIAALGADYAMAAAVKQCVLDRIAQVIRCKRLQRDAMAKADRREAVEVSS